MIFLNVCINLGIELSEEAQEFLEANNGANQIALERVQQYLNTVSLSGNSVDSYDFVRENYLIIKYKAQ